MCRTIPELQERRGTDGVVAESSLLPGAPVGEDAPSGRALGAHANRVLSQRQDVPIRSRLARCEVSFDVWALARRQEAQLPLLRRLASGAARQALRCDGLLFDRAA